MGTRESFQVRGQRAWATSYETERLYIELVRTDGFEAQASGL